MSCMRGVSVRSMITIETEFLLGIRYRGCVGGVA